MKNFIHLFFALAALIPAGCTEPEPNISPGNNIIKEGTTDSLTWRLAGDGTLTIGGTGAIPDYYFLGYDYIPVSHWVMSTTTIKMVVIEAGVTGIGNYAFSDCTDLSSITIPGSVTSIADYAFSGCTNLSSITIPDTVTSIGFGAFENCTSLSSISIPDTVTSIGDSAFSGCTTLSSINIPEGVTIIGNRLFQDCASLSSITIPEGATSIGAEVFKNCTGLLSIVIPDNVTGIGAYAFDHCGSLSDVFIGSGIKSMAQGSFDYCPLIASMTIMATTPPSLSLGRTSSSMMSSEWYVNNFNYRVDTLYIPKGCMEAYLSVVTHDSNIKRGPYSLYHWSSVFPNIVELDTQ